MKRINVIIFAGLGDNALASHILPLLKKNNMGRIFIIRNSAGKKSPSVAYISTYLKHPFLIILSKFAKALKCVKENRVDYVHSFYFIPHGLIALVLAKLLRKKVGVSLIGTDLDIHLKKRFYGSFLTRLLNFYDVVTVTGSKSREYLKKRGIKSFILPHCIDQNIFRPEEKVKKFDLLYVGRLSEEKRIDRIIEVVAETKKEEDIRLAIIGKGPEEERLKAIVKRENLEVNILFLGYQDKVTPYYNMSKMLILMSASEGLPLVLIEAMACGVVPAVLNVGDIGDIVNESNGLIFDQYNPRKIAKSILFVLNNPKDYQQLKENSLKIRDIRGLETGSMFWDKIFKSMALHK
jgi:glycosyltransferase involved in cell wall biosynthesis